MSNTPIPHAPSSAPVSPAVDFDVVRAEMVNCVLLAVEAIETNNPQVRIRVQLSRFRGLGVGFFLRIDPYGTRFFGFQVVDPNGTRVNVMRLDEAGEFVAFDEFDTAFVQAIGQCLPQTVCKAWTAMVPIEPAPSPLPPDYTLH